MPDPSQGPQQTRFYRIVAFLSRLQLRYQHKNRPYRKIFTTIYLFLATVTALGTITAMAYLTDLLLLFPPLGPSAFILFYTPLAESASPRNLILAHTVAVMCGLAALTVAKLLFPEMPGTAATTLNWYSITAIGLAMGGVSICMVLIKCVHPPAAATALIAAMGYLDNVAQVGGVIIAVLFLAMEAILFNRFIGGLPYPYWRHDPNIDRTYQSLTGQSPQSMSRWQKLAEKTFDKR